MTSIQLAARRAREAQATLARHKANLAQQIQRGVEQQKAQVAAEDMYRAYGPVSSVEVLGRQTDSLSPAKYMAAPVVPTTAAITIKSDIAAPLKTDKAGRVGTAKYYFTGRKYGPVVERREVLARPNIVQKMFSWIRRAVAPAVKTDMVSAHMRRRAVISPMKNIQARLAQQAQVVKAAKARSYIHKWGDWAITYKRGRPIVPPKQITAGAPGLAPSLGQYDTFALRNWEDQHGRISSEAVSPYYARTMRR